MYFSRIPEGKSVEDFIPIKAGDRTFYCEKQENSPSKYTPRRRLSDQFKDPSFIVKDTFRRLSMIKTFKMKHRDMDEMTERYISSIEACVSELKKDFGVDPKSIFQSFDLKQFGINPEDFGVEEGECMAVED